MIRAEQLADCASGPFLAACLLLVVAGASKLRRGGLERGAGIAELIAGIAGAGIGRAGALAVAGCYVVLAMYAWRLLRVAPTKPCNCLGASSAPVTPGHVVMNLGAGAIALAAAAGPSPFAQLADQPLTGVPYLVLVGTCAALGAIVLGAYADARAELERNV